MAIPHRGDFAQQIGVILDPNAPNSSQAIALSRVDRRWTVEECNEVCEYFGGKKKKGNANSGVKFIINAFEKDVDENTLLFLCRIVQTIVECTKREGNKRKEREFIKADLVSCLLRCIRRRLHLTSSWESDDRRVDEEILHALLATGTRDSRFSLKIRVGGLNYILAKLFVGSSIDVLPCSFLHILIYSLKSPRNSQWMGRQSGFVVKLVKSIDAFSNSRDDVNLIVLDQLLQMLYLISKNRKSRLSMIKEGVVKVLMNIVCQYVAMQPSLLARIFPIFASSNADKLSSVHANVIVGGIALLKFLANNKKAREEMITHGVLELCERELDAKETTSADGEERAMRIKIKESLCSLCLRCLPHTTFPLENVRFPVVYPLSPTFNLNSSFDDARSSDDDRGDEEDGEFNHSSILFSDSAEENDEKEEVEVPLPKVSRQPPAKLMRYKRYFEEFFLGASGDLNATSRPEIDERQLYTLVHEATRFVMPVVKVVGRDLNLGKEVRQELAHNPNKMQSIVMEELNKTRLRANFKNAVVFDLDAIVDGNPVRYEPPTLGRLSANKCLAFESRFESGNLRRATQVAATHYELILSPDVNQMREHYQWFYFEVSNMKKDQRYTFEIINCMKSTSMYSQGMQPVMFSVQDAENGNDGWRRCGENVCYYRNRYSNLSQHDEQSGEEKKKRYFYSIRFDVTFRYTADICYLAYHFPYTYTFLNTSLRCMQLTLPLGVVYREDVIATTLGGNAVKLLTVTAIGSASQVASREIAVVSARVHPGESNASWIMHGLIEFLIRATSEEACKLRERYVFKIVPMINPDGVVNGSHRCSLAGVDLNRVWCKPDENIHPEIFHFKGVIQYMCEKLNRKPAVFVDLHGHSRKWGAFVFGNNGVESWRPADRLVTAADSDRLLMLPSVLSKNCPMFSLEECRFAIARNKESSARVNVWRQFGVVAAYTLESTYCGFNSGDLKGFQISTSDLKHIGRSLACSFLELASLDIR